ncbi:MAG: cell surface protein SprA [Chitinophagaceae bacterium]|nr:cell surface protein SprA [Chitinophagaceae bacterium]
MTNFDFSYSYIQTLTHNPLIEKDELRRTRGVLGYTYAPQARSLEPFKKFIKSKSPWLSLIRDFNFNYAPSQISFRADLLRQFGATRLRNIGGGPYKIPETFNKYFTFDRYYILQWPLTQSLNIDFSAINNARIDEPFGHIDTRAKKDSVRKNVLKGGRNTNYRQDLTINYQLPTQKIPLLSWTAIRASYNTRYNWVAASLLERTPEINLGHTLSNTQTRTLNGEFKLEELYYKSRLLRAILADNNTNIPGMPGRQNDGDKKGKKEKDKGKNNKENINVKTEEQKTQVEDFIFPTQQQQQSAEPKADTIRNKKGKIIKIKKPKKKKEKKQKEPKDPNRLPEVGKFAKFFGRILTSVKRVGVQYTEDMGTTLPGYMDSTRIFGYNPRSRQPGFDFIFGYQPDTNWINRMGARGLFSTDTLVTKLIQQRYNQRLNMTAQVSPFRDFNIDITLDKTFDKQYSELYKDTSKFDNIGLTRLNPYAMGSFSISYISFQTLFTRFNPEEVSENFKKFESYRSVLSKRLAALNPYQGGVIDPNDPEYYKGYGRYAQDVVIPAFLAAYTKKDPQKVTLMKSSNPNIRSNPFAGLIPLPNWTITYNGLSRIPGLDKIFTNFSIRHGYQSTLSMNSFNTALLFLDPLRVGYPYFRDTLTGNYIPYFLVPNITIQEAFSPLLEVDITFTNQISTRFEYSKRRQLSLSLIDYQLAENQSTEITFGFNWRRKGFPGLSQIKFGKKEFQLDNDVNIRCDISVRDDATANSKLDQRMAFGTGGQKVIRIAPSIDYVLNNRINLRLFFEQNRNIPKISNAFPVSNTRAGVQIRVSLAQ